MHYELEARTIHGMEEQIENLKNMLKNIETDFANCARGDTPCFYCANNETCSYSYNNRHCNFVWKSHN